MAESPALTVNQFVALSDLFSRAQLAHRMGTGFNGLRDHYQTFGYERTLTFKHYWNEYKRGGLAKRIINLPCDATWRHAPEITDDDTPDKNSEFETGWLDLNKRLGVIFRLHRADILASIGQYSILLMGINNISDLSTELPNGLLKRPEDLVYLQPYHQDRAKILTMVDDPKSARQGLPLMYEITLGTPDGQNINAQSRTVRVHHSRVLHFAKRCLEDDVYGTPELEAVFNYLYDLMKVTGGGAEGFWINSANKIKAELQDGFSAPDATSITDLKDKMTEFTHELSSWLIGNGWNFERMGVQIADPTGAYKVVIGLIAGITGIPQRKLLGSEAGELASSQDDENWNHVTMELQSQSGEPIFLRPTITRFIELGALKPPKSGQFKVTWKNPFELSDTEKADLAFKRADAASKYTSSGAEMVLGQGEFRESMGLPAELPEEDVRRAEEHALDEEDEQVQDEFAKSKLKRVA